MNIINAILIERRLKKCFKKARSVISKAHLFGKNEIKYEYLNNKNTRINFSLLFESEWVTLSYGLIPDSVRDEATKMVKQNLAAFFKDYIGNRIEIEKSKRFDDFRSEMDIKFIPKLAEQISKMANEYISSGKL